MSWITPTSAAFWPILLWLLSFRFFVGLHKAAIIIGYVLASVVGYSRLVIHGILFRK